MAPTAPPAVVPSTSTTSYNFGIPAIVQNAPTSTGNTKDNAAAVISCPQCTFYNPYFAEVCEVCCSPLKTKG